MEARPLSTLERAEGEIGLEEGSGNGGIEGELIVDDSLAAMEPDSGYNLIFNWEFAGRSGRQKKGQEESPAQIAIRNDRIYLMVPFSPLG